MEAEPLDVVHEYDARRHEQLGKVDGIDALLLMLFKLNTRVLKQINGVLRVHILAEMMRLITQLRNLHISKHLRETKLEIKLPCREVRRRVAIFIHECEAELDNLQQIDIAAKQLVLVISSGTKLPDRPGHDA